MNENYNQSIELKCLTCGDNNFTFNDDKSSLKVPALLFVI